MVNGVQLKEIINEMGNAIEENKQYLTDLDAAIGDGDHGHNMSKGFQSVKLKLEDCSDDISSILKTTGMALVSSVGGASGPLYGTAFIKAAAAMQGRKELSLEDFEKLLESALDGIMMRGKARVNEKTIIDSLHPGIQGLKRARQEGKDFKDCMMELVDSAEKGVEHTKKIFAQKGRASYLGERSIGHADPGATSCYIMLKAVADYFEK